MIQRFDPAAVPPNTPFRSATHPRECGDRSAMHHFGQESTMSETAILVVLGIKLAMVVFGVLAIGAVLWWIFR